MTEKRFKVYKVIGSFHEWSVEDSFDDKVVFGSIMHKYNADRLCAKLNELAEKKEILEVQLNELAEENKQLKSDLTHTKVLYHSLQDTYSGLLKLVHGFNGD